MDDLGYLAEVKQARRVLMALRLEVDSKIADDVAQHVEAAFRAIKVAAEPIKFPRIGHEDDERDPFTEDTPL